jgi:hypothetical protein
MDVKTARHVSALLKREASELQTKAMSLGQAVNLIVWDDSAAATRFREAWSNVASLNRHVWPALQDLSRALARAADAYEAARNTK